MSYLVLARKWRPTTFDEVVGQEHVTRTLKNAIERNRVAHALLFTGSRGVGKTSCARILAKALNCEQGPTPEPCGVCRWCTDITNGASVDVFEIDGASNNSVEQIREIRESVKFVSTRGKRKMYIIDEVHMLSTAAFNALLKTLEEPPEHVLFVFATTEPHKIPDTIISRCQRYDFKRIPERKIVDALLRIVATEDIKVEEAALHHIAREAKGGMRDSLSLLDQVIAFSGTEITEARTREVLGVADRAVLHNLTRAILDGDSQGALETTDQLFEFGLDLQKFAGEFVKHVRDLMVIRTVEHPERLVDLPESEIAALADQVADIHPARIHRLFSALLKGADEITRSAFPKLALEMTLLRLCHQGSTLPLSEVLDGLARLEARLDEPVSPDDQPPGPPGGHRPTPSSPAGSGHGAQHAGAGHATGPQASLSPAPAAQAAPVQAAPVPVAPAHAAPVQAAPVPVAPAHAAPIHATPPHSAPIQAAPIQAAPVQAAPVQAAPVQAAPAQAAPVQAAPVQAAPVQASPVQAAPVQASPVQAAPVQAAPVQAAPVQAAPVHAAPVHAAPVHAVPVKAAPPRPVSVAASPATGPVQKSIGPNRALRSVPWPPPHEMGLSPAHVSTVVAAAIAAPRTPRAAAPAPALSEAAEEPAPAATVGSAAPAAGSAAPAIVPKQPTTTTSPSNTVAGPPQWHRAPNDDIPHAVAPVDAAAATLSEPAAATVELLARLEQAEASPADARFAHVLAVMARTDRFLATALEHDARLVSFDDEVLSLVVPESEAELADRARSRLADVAELALGHPIRVQLDVATADDPRLVPETLYARRQRLAEEARQRRRESARRHPGVLCAVETLGARILDIVVA